MSEIEALGGMLDSQTEESKEEGILTIPTEPEELKELKSRFGWKKPTGCYWRTEKARYQDLYVYFDGESKEPVNKLADIVFPPMCADPKVPMQLECPLLTSKYPCNWNVLC